MPGPAESDPVPNSFRVTRELLEWFDYSKGCPKCEALRRGDVKQTAHHSKECRQTIEERIKEYPELKNKLSEVEEMQHRWIRRRIEALDAGETHKPATEEASVASAPAMTMVRECEFEQLPVGSPTRPSGQWRGRPHRRGQIAGGGLGACQ